MRVLSALTFASAALAARPYLEEPDTGIDDQLSKIVANGTIAPLSSMVGLPDFQWAARHYMNLTAYTYYRNGAGGEWSYRNNLEVFQRYRLRPRRMIDITNINASLPTTILGNNVSAPIFISPCARAGYAHPDAELGLVKGAAQGNVLYIPSNYATKNMSEIYAAKSPNQVMFQQIYLNGGLNDTAKLFKAAEAGGAKAIVLTIDSAGNAIRHRAFRFGVGSANTGYTKFTWELFHQLEELTSLPIVPKGIQTVEDAREAVNQGVKAFFISNHGGRQIDGSPSSLEVALEIYENDPSIFDEVEVYADGGVRYGTDVLKLLALGVRAVGVGRPMMYANIYGAEGVAKAVEMLKYEVVNDGANLGVPDLKQITPDYVNWKSLNVWGS